MNELGYCCINLSINEGVAKKDQIKVNRGMVKRTFESKGTDYVSECIIENLKDTIKILNWNVRNNIKVYRLSSDSFPWLTEYCIDDIKNSDKIKNLLKGIGEIIKKNGLRSGYHPGPYCVLGSENTSVVEKTIKELEFTATLLDMMGLDRTPYYGINIHLNSTKPDHETAAKRFCENFQRLSDSVRSRLTVENDDKAGQYSVKMLYDMVHKEIGIPIVFDFHHFNYGPQDQTIKQSLELALSTWQVKPMTHMSSSKLIETNGSRATAHADYIYEEIPLFDSYHFDCEIEAKAKELAVLKYRTQFK